MNFLNFVAGVICVVLVASCGGGGGDSAGPMPATTPDTETPSITVKGTAATGLAIAGAAVTGKCKVGSGTTFTLADGTFSLVVKDGQLPCLLQITNPADGTKMHTIASGDGNAAIANITPITEMITARVLGSEPNVFFAVFDANIAAKKVTTANVHTAQTDVGLLLTGTVDIAAITDFISAPLKAATKANASTGDSYDKLLDALKLKLSSAQISTLVTALANNETVVAIKQKVNSLTTLSTLPPVARAGTEQSVVTGTVVTLDAGASSSSAGSSLTYTWALLSKPAGSSAELSSLTSVKPTFTADVPGTYVASLIVSDGKVNSSTATVTVTAASTANTVSAPILKSISGVLTGNGQSVLFTFVLSEDVDKSFTKDDVNITCGKTNTVSSEGIVNVPCGNKDVWTTIDATHYTLVVNGLTDSNIITVTATVDVYTFTNLTGNINMIKRSGTVSINATGPTLKSVERTGYDASTKKMAISLTFNDDIVKFNYDKIHVTQILSANAISGLTQFPSSDLSKINDKVWKMMVMSSMIDTPVFIRMDEGSYMNVAGFWNTVPSEYIIDTPDVMTLPSVSYINITDEQFDEVSYSFLFNKFVKPDVSLFLKGLDIVGASSQVKFIGQSTSSSVDLKIVPYSTSNGFTFTIKEGAYKDVYGNANTDKQSVTYKRLPYASGYKGTSPSKTFSKNDIANNTVNVQSIEGGSFSVSLDATLNRGVTDVWWPDVPGEGPGAIFTTDNNFTSPTLSWGYGLSPSEKPGSLSGTVGAPGNSTADISEYSTLGIELATNPELANNPSNNFIVMLISPTVNGCATELTHSVHVFSVSAYVYRLPLSEFDLAKYCPSYDTLPKALAAGVAKIKILLPGDNMQYNNPKGATQFSNGLALGKIWFYGASSTGSTVAVP